MKTKAFKTYQNFKKRPSEQWLIWRLSGAVVTAEIAGAEMNLGL